MTLQPDDFWSFNEWLMRPNSFLESALLQGLVLIVLAIVLGLIVGYIVSAARYGPVEGFYAVARAVRELLLHDGPRTSPRRIVALARLAFKEAIRRKVLFVVGLFVVLLLFAGWFLNEESRDPARLYISFVLTTTNYLILLLALFISTFSIPADVKEKTIYTIVTKPVRITELVLGRMLGFIAVGTLMLAPMALLSGVFVKRGLDHVHQVETVEEEGDGSIVGTTDYVQGHEHTFRFAADQDQTVTNKVRGHRHVVTKTKNDDGSYSFDFSGPVDSLVARVPLYGEIQFYDRMGEPKNAGIDVGQESIVGGYSSAGVSRLIGVAQGPRKIEYGYVEGGTLGAAEFTFGGVSAERFGNTDTLLLDMQIRAFRSYKGDIETGIHGSLTFKNPDKPIQSEPIAFIVDEYELDEQQIPVELEIIEDGKTSTGNLFEKLVSDDGQLQLVLRCTDDAQYLGVTRSAVYLRPAEVAFEVNLAKAYASIWLQMVMVIAFGVMFSTRLGGPVAMVSTGVLCVVLSFFAEQIYDTRHYIDIGQERGGGPVESLIRLVKQDALTTQLDLDSTTTKVIKTTDAGIVYAMDALATAVPNLPKMVETAEYAASGFDIPVALVGRHATATFGYFLLAFLISYFLLKAREIAA
ncbi:MAG: ABC transporter permease [Planctomycetota bacterium]